MYEHLEHQHNDNKNKTNSGSQENLFHNLKQTKEEKEKMEKDVQVFQRLAQYYYDIESEEPKPGQDRLYTIVCYQDTEILVPIGTGKYASDMFTNKHTTGSVWFLYGPLNLFVVKANTHDDTNVNPRRFLNEYASFYSPVGGQVHIHTPGASIEYGKYNKIMSYEEAVNALQNANIRKEYYSRTNDKRNNVDEKFCKKMRNLKEETHTVTKNTEKLEVRYNKAKFDYDHEEYMKMRNCLDHLSDGDIEKMYDLVQNFDRHKGVFVQSDSI